MGLIAGAGPQYFAWQSWKLGWIDDSQVMCRASAGGDTVRLTAVEYVPADLRTALQVACLHAQ
ncbi:hypothetical protein ADL29_10870 [Streptomyces chattanoogensis]|uniref:Uncharacterized protein n=2 Tax=Streptomyces chattanoogensis TaxID=66876 RepID=A0A0N0H1P8_9ACTN|nr:hypothetical protein ADL29_10870 [Streptomyces chattanoogensis]